MKKEISKAFHLWHYRGRYRGVFVRKIGLSFTVPTAPTRILPFITLSVRSAYTAMYLCHLCLICVKIQYSNRNIKLSFDSVGPILK